MIPASHDDLLTRPIIVSLATQMHDGSIQTQPVWCSYDGTHLRISTLIGRQKFLNLSRRSVATILAMDPEDPNRWLEVRGRMNAWQHSGAKSQVDALALQYLGTSEYEEADGDSKSNRVTVLIEPVRVVAAGRSYSPAASSL